MSGPEFYTKTTTLNKSIVKIASHQLDIIVVDDDEDDCYIVNQSFNVINWNSRIKFLSSGESVLGYLKNLSHASFPSLILLDYNMPKMNGEEVLVRLKEQEAFSSIPVVIYSTGMTELLSRKLNKMGAEDCYRKPENIEDCIQLAELLKHKVQMRLANF